MPHTRKPWVLPIVFLCLVLLAPFTFETKPVPTKTQAQSINIPTPVEVSAPNQLAQALSENTLPEVLEAPAPAAVDTRPGGLSLRISAINLSIPLGRTRLDAQGRLAVPANANSAAWYEAGPKIGNPGTALITGHLESTSFKPGVFYNLRKLGTGDRIEVGRPDGSIAVYKVAKLESYNQDNTFPWNKVYSENGPASLRLITCAGYYSESLGRYTKNLVVYATLVSIERPAN